MPFPRRCSLNHFPWTPPKFFSPVYFGSNAAHVAAISIASRFRASIPHILDGGMSHQPDNIFAGTQVVSLVEVRGTNDSLVHPRGAVGVVTRTPAGDQNQFLVRFPDGFEASLTREQRRII